MTGKVWIVGAGPGDRKLITLRGLECLRCADVVVYDRLLDPALLDEAPPSAERIYVGKEADKHAVPQARIQELLALYAELGRRVVRLKGGDPFVFGRGAEEAAFLRARGIDFEIVPGVSSAVAVPELAGIPLTHRGVASSFAVATGHLCGLEPGVDYAALLRAAGTLVILMGVRALPRIAAQLLESGIDPKTPVAVLENGSHPDERTTVSTLEHVERDAAGARSPAVIVIGAVVGVRSGIIESTLAETVEEQR